MKFWTDISDDEKRYTGINELFCGIQYLILQKETQQLDSEGYWTFGGMNDSFYMPAEMKDYHTELFNDFQPFPTRQIAERFCEIRSYFPGDGKLTEKYKR